MVYALDTNTIIRYLRKEANTLRNFNKAVMNRANFAIPRVVDYEIQRGFHIYPAPSKLAAYKKLIGKEFCNIAEIDVYCWERAGHIYEELYHKKLTIGELDILIAAICLENGYTLVTNNTKDFENINSLNLDDWQKDD